VLPGVWLWAMFAVGGVWCSAVISVGGWWWAVVALGGGGGPSSVLVACGGGPSLTLMGGWWWDLAAGYVAALLLRAVTVIWLSSPSIVGFCRHRVVSPSSIVVVVMSCRHLLVGQVRWVGTEVLTNGRGRTMNVLLSKINVKDKWDDVVGRKKGGKKKELRKEDNST